MKYSNTHSSQRKLIWNLPPPRVHASPLTLWIVVTHYLTSAITQGYTHPLSLVMKSWVLVTVGDVQSWHGCVPLGSLSTKPRDRNESPSTIPQCRFNKSKQHTYPRKKERNDQSAVLLRTTGMRHKYLGGVSGVAAHLTKHKTKSEPACTGKASGRCRWARQHPSDPYCLPSFGQKVGNEYWCGGGTKAQLLYPRHVRIGPHHLRSPVIKVYATHERKKESHYK